MKFLLHEIEGGGCDYTIGCGVRITSIAANSMEDAVAIVKGNDKYGEPTLDAKRLEAAFVYEVVSEHELDLRSIQQEREADLAAKATHEKDAAERRTYELLREKYG